MNWCVGEAEEFKSFLLGADQSLARATELLVALQKDKREVKTFELENYLEDFKTTTRASLPYANIMRKVHALAKRAGNLETYLQVLLCPKADHYGGKGPNHECEMNNSHGNSIVFQHELDYNHL